MSVESESQATQTRPQVCSIAEYLYVENFVLPGLHAACNVLRAAYIESNAPRDKVKFRIVAKSRLENLQPDQRAKLYYEYMETLRSSVLKREPRALKRPYNLFHVKRMADKYLVDHATYAKAIGCNHPDMDEWIRLCESTHLTEKWRDVIQSSNSTMEQVVKSMQHQVLELETAKDLEDMVHDELYEDEDLKALQSQYDVRRLVKGDRPALDHTPWIFGMIHGSRIQRMALAVYAESVKERTLEYHQTILGLAMDMTAMQRVMDYLCHSAALSEDQRTQISECLEACKTCLSQYESHIAASKAWIDAQ